MEPSPSLTPSLEDAVDVTVTPPDAPRAPEAEQERPAVDRRRAAFRQSLLAIPIAAGLARIAGSPRAARRAAGLTAIALGALRWQLGRWFLPTPAYTVEGRLGDLELRRYPSQLEARTELRGMAFEDALDYGFGRLACYIFGANAASIDLAMATPAITALYPDGHYAMSFLMPPGHVLMSLPEPTDPRVELVAVPERRVAALAFHGRFSRQNVGGHEKSLIGEVARANLTARGVVMFAAYDAPATAPLLRRNEVWLELA